MLACLWFMLVYEKEDTMVHYVPSGSAYAGCIDVPTGCFWQLYVVSVNNGIYLLMGVDLNAHSALEHIFVGVCAPLGALVHAYMIGQVILLIQRRGALATKQNEHTLAVQQAMRILSLPPNLQMRIIAFFTYERIHRSGRSFQALFAELSPQLRFELHLHLYFDLVRKCGLFRKTRPKIIRDIVMNLKDMIFLPGDWICRYGDYGDSMYFLVSGRCAVIDKDATTELKYLEKGSYFGEVALLTGVPRTAFVRANAFCIMAQLTKEGFEPIIKKWPEEIDVLISSVDNLGDRQKIKVEASKHYGLTRRMSRVSMMTDEESSYGARRSSMPARSAARSSFRMGLASRDESRLSVCSKASSKDSESAKLLEKLRHRSSDAPEMAPRLRHSMSGPTVLSTVYDGVDNRRVSWDDTTSDSLSQKSVEAWSAPEYPTLMTSASNIQSKGNLHAIGKRCLSPLGRPPGVPDNHSAARPPELAKPEAPMYGSYRRSVQFMPEVIEMPEVMEDITSVDEQSVRPSPGNRAPIVELPGDCSVPSVKAVGLAGNSASVVAPAKFDPQQHLDFLCEANPVDLQWQLNDVVKHVSNLQAEVIKQREMQTLFWASMKQWTCEAVREAVSQELGQLQGVVASNRSSTISCFSADDRSSSRGGDPDAGGGGVMGISTPYT